MKKIFSLTLSILILIMMLAADSSASGSLSVSIIIPPIYNEALPAASAPPLDDTSSLPSSIHSVEVVGCFIKEGTYNLRVFNSNELSDTVSMTIRIFDRKEGADVKNIHIDAVPIEGNSVIRIAIPLVKDNNLTVFSSLLKGEYNIETSVCRI